MHEIMIWSWRMYPAAGVAWLFAACVCIGLGELLESSYYIGVLRWGQRTSLLC